MTQTLRALLFGTAAAAALTAAMNVYAAEPVRVIRLEGIQVVAHKTSVDVVRLDTVVVTAHRDVA